MDNNILDFENACSDLETCVPLLAEQKISSLLTVIAKNKFVYQIIEKCMNGYSYYENKSSYFVLVGGSIGGKFCPPADRREFIAMGFSFFYEINSGKISLMEVLDIYFAGKNYKEKYLDFAERVVKVFSSSVLSIYSDVVRLSTQKNIDIDNSAEIVESRYVKNKKISFLEEEKNLVFSMKMSDFDKKYAIYFINKII